MYSNGADKKLLEFRPSVIALSALLCNLNKSLSPASDANLHCTLTSLLDHDRKVEDRVLILHFSINDGHNVLCY